MTLRRKTPLRRTGRLKRTRMKRVNAERAEKRRAECFGEQADLCRKMPCVACEATTYPGLPAWAWAQYTARTRRAPVLAWAGSDPHHEPTRAAGGKDKDTVPLCREHHDERHRIGRRAFEEKYGVDLRAVAAAIHQEMTKGRDDDE